MTDTRTLSDPEVVAQPPALERGDGRLGLVATTRPRDHEAAKGPDGRRATDVAPGATPLTLLERSAWSLVWLAVLIAGCQLWGSWWSWPIIDVVATALVVAAFGGLVACWCSSTPRVWWHQGWAMASGLVAAVVPQTVNIHSRIFYSTDAAALDHVAARVLVHGHDPYTTSLASAAALLKTPAHFWTYTVAGGHITNVSYPPGSFLFYALGMALGFHHAVVDWVDLYAWVASAVLLFCMLPKSLRWLAALVATMGFFTGLFASGGTDALFIPFAMLAVWRWDRYGQGPGAGVARWMGPVALGLACCVKQTPWFCVPFLVVGIYLEARRSGRSPLPVVARYLGTVVAVFAAVNLPFALWGASAWWHGIWTPMSQPLVADGQGLISLALHGLTGGADLRLLMVTGMLALLGLLAAFAAWYHRLKRVWLLLLPVAFFFSTRSFSSYLIDLFPIALVAILTTAPAPPRPGSWRVGRLRVADAVVGVLAVSVVLTAALSFSGGTLDLAYRGALVGGGQQRLESVTVSVTNPTGATVVPHFMVDAGAPHPTGFWAAAHHRPVVLGPHQSVTVTLYPPTPTYFPAEASHFVVQAYTSNPESLSTTGEIWHNFLPRSARR